MPPIKKLPRRYLPTKKTYTQALTMFRNALKFANSYSTQKLNFEEPFVCPLCYIEENNQRTFKTPLNFKYHVLNKHSDMVHESEEVRRLNALERRRESRRTKKQTQAQSSCNLPRLE